MTFQTVAAHALSATMTSGAASLVEFVEALTVVLAVGATRGWRSAGVGVVAALVSLVVLVALLGPALQGLPLAPARFGIGTLLVLFGTRWLRKATRRAAGVLPLRREDVAFRRYRTRLDGIAAPVARWDIPGFAAAFQATLIEGLEVVFIVVAVGAGGSGLLRPAILGAVLALALVACLGALLHRPMTRLPENSLKRLVGAMVSGFGTFWIGEAAGLAWPGGDVSIPMLGLSYLLLSILVAGWLRRGIPGRPS